MHSLKEVAPVRLTVLLGHFVRGEFGLEVPGGQKNLTLHLFLVAKYRGVPLKQ
jgi:hypothetical protein